MNPIFVPHSNVSTVTLDDFSAAVVIGDKAIGLHQKFSYVYDLGEEWMRFTGLPFVFAAWVSTRELETAFIREFNNALALGLAHIPQLIYLLPTPTSGFDLKEYFTHHISYHLDKDKKKGLELFLDSISPVIELEYH